MLLYFSCLDDGNGDESLKVINEAVQKELNNFAVKSELIITI